jgi:hypothetical protein
VCFAGDPELGVNASINNCRQLLGQFGMLLRFKCIAVRLIRWQTLDSAACTQCRIWRIPRSKGTMDADDFRRIALSLEGAEESSHMGQPDFRVGGRIFATLVSAPRATGT